jgi:hypothetical protein
MGAISNLRGGAATESRELEAEASAGKLKALVERVVRVAQPGDGGATLLFTLGRLASSSRWVDAGLCVEISGDDVASTLEIYASHGTTRERIVSPTALAIPVDEFLAALEGDPEIVGALRAEVGPRKLSLSARTSGMHERFEASEQTVHTKTTVPKMTAVTVDPPDRSEKG